MTEFRAPAKNRASPISTARWSHSANGETAAHPAEAGLFSGSISGMLSRQRLRAERRPAALEPLSGSDGAARVGRRLVRLKPRQRGDPFGARLPRLSVRLLERWQCMERRQHRRCRPRPHLSGSRSPSSVFGGRRDGRSLRRIAWGRARAALDRSHGARRRTGRSRSRRCAQSAGRDLWCLRWSRLEGCGRSRMATLGSRPEGLDLARWQRRSSTDHADRDRALRGAAVPQPWNGGHRLVSRDDPEAGNSVGGAWSPTRGARLRGGRSHSRRVRAHWLWHEHLGYQS